MLQSKCTHCFLPWVDKSPLQAGSCAQRCCGPSWLDGGKRLKESFLLSGLNCCFLVCSRRRACSESRSDLLNLQCCAELPMRSAHVQSRSLRCSTCGQTVPGNGAPHQRPIVLSQHVANSDFVYKQRQALNPQPNTRGRRSTEHFPKKNMTGQMTNVSVALRVGGPSQRWRKPAPRAVHLNVLSSRRSHAVEPRGSFRRGLCLSLCSSQTTCSTLTSCSVFTLLMPGSSAQVSLQGGGPLPLARTGCVPGPHSA